MIDVEHDPIEFEYAHPAFMASFKSSKQSSIYTVIEADNDRTLLDYTE